MIELAPNHKIGLSLANPVMIAAGCNGYGTAYQRLLDLTVFGAVVTQPISLRPWHGPAQPRLVETKAGFILNHNLENLGVRKVIHQYQKSWARLGVPVIAHLPADQPDDLHRTARALAGTGSLAAIELGLPEGAIPSDIESWIKAIRTACLLPLLLKLPFEDALDLAMTAIISTAEAVVVCAPPLGAAVRQPGGEFIRGQLYSPVLHSLVLERVLALQSLLDLPVVAVGGIHTLADVQAFLEAGARAVQIDSLLFVDPMAAEKIAKAF